ncbi:glycosyltransferase (plasmid) [Chromobacterium amazonense]|uniref:glycosyltransferase n=1 Tax=Chromobacterium amazonense TaxID=1382803 RepID=UPI00237E08B2|nr:glycosyltransferase [Chromobacterium amazonense]MDE1713183.1 glycosyltransferase [Chromobacterium amazonense]
MLLQHSYNKENARPLLSVIIPAIKVDLELRRCIDSVRLACGMDNNRCEIVLVMPRCEVEAAKTSMDGVTTFVEETRKGIYAAMNDGIRASCGRYLFFLGKDDIVLSPFGKVLDQLAQEGGCAAFYDVYWGKEGVYSGRPSKWRVLLRNFCHQGIIYSREVIDKHGPYLRRMRVQADHLLNIRLLWDSRFAPSVRYFCGGRVWYAADGFSSVARDPLFWRLYPIILKRYVAPAAGMLLSASRWLRGKNI